MIHERALQAALGGGPILADLARHVEECPECRRELADLRALEAELREAAPRVRFEAGWRDRRSGVDRPKAPPMRWTSLAASLILGAALVSTWLSLTPATPGSSVSSASPIAQAQATDGAVPQSSISSLMWGGTYEDSTTALLDMVEPLAQEMPSTPPEAITNYLSPAESGGWNG